MKLWYEIVCENNSVHEDEFVGDEQDPDTGENLAP
jgi:hypothetical protein